MRFMIGLLALLLTSTAFTQSIKMKINGVTAASGEEVLAFQTAVIAPTSTGSGGGTVVGAPAFDKVEFKKTNNTSTNAFFQKCLGGQQLGDVTFEFYDGANTMYYKILLSNTNITKFSYLVPECTGCTKMYHDMALIFQKIEVTDLVTGITLKYNLATRAFY